MIDQIVQIFLMPRTTSPPYRGKTYGGVHVSDDTTAGWRFGIEDGSSTDFFELPGIYLRAKRVPNRSWLKK